MAISDNEWMFTKKLYEVLRDYQAKTIKGNGTVVGNLDQELTAVYDGVVKAYREVYADAS